MRTISIICSIYLMVLVTVNMTNVDAGILNNGFLTYFGGSADEYISNTSDLSKMSMALDSDNNIIIVGRTASVDFPVSANAFQSSRKTGGTDAFITKIDSAGQQIIFSTYLGGHNNDWATDVAVDSTGNIFVVGTTASTDFPVTADATQPSHGGGGPVSNLDTFIAKFSPNGTLLYSSYYGGNKDDWGYGIATDIHGNFAITGSTYSTNLPMVHAFQPNYGAGGVDAFVATFNNNGTTMLFSSYLGGSQNDWGKALAFDNESNVVLTGGSASSSNFPQLNAVQPTYGGGSYDTIIAKFFLNGTLVFSTFYGGSSEDEGLDIIAWDTQFAIVGATHSANLTVGTTFQSQLGGDEDCFITVLPADGQTITWMSYCGGTAADTASSIATDLNHNLVVCGATESTNFPIINPFSLIKGSNADVFIIKVTKDGSKLLSSSVFGGNGLDQGYSVAIDSDNQLYCTGYTSSTNFPVFNAYQSTKKGITDIFVGKIYPASTTTSPQTQITFEVIGPFLAIISLAIKKSHSHYSNKDPQF